MRFERAWAGGCGCDSCTRSTGRRSKRAEGGRDGRARQGSCGRGACLDGDHALTKPASGSAQLGMCAGCADDDAVTICCVCGEPRCVRPSANRTTRWAHAFGVRARAGCLTLRPRQGCTSSQRRSSSIEGKPCIMQKKNWLNTAGRDSHKSRYRPNNKKGLSALSSGGSGFRYQFYRPVLSHEGFAEWEFDRVISRSRRAVMGFELAF